MSARRAIAALAVVSAVTLDCGGGAPEPPAPLARNLVIYLVDTLRADHVGCYGYGLPTTPALDDFARQGVLFVNAYAQSSWTRPSVASIFTGVGPRRHGANRRREQLAPESVTLAELLSAAGFDSAGFVANPNVAGAFGFRQGFAPYRRLNSRRSGETVRRAAVEWLEARPAGDRRPFFLYLHTVEPHGPYRDALERAAAFGARLSDPEIGSRRFLERLKSRPLAATPETLAELRALYDAEVAENDQRFADFLADLARLGLEDETAILFVSDHGEEFGEHGGFEHGKSLYEEVLRVPLALRVPGRFAGTRVVERVQHVDLLPTLLEILGVPAPPGLEGRSLLPASRGEPMAAADVVTDLDVDGHRIAAIHRGRWKLVRGGGGPDSDPLTAPARLFDLDADPAERRDLAAEQPGVVEALTQRLRLRMAGPTGRPRSPEAEIDEELRRQLEALGYVQPQR